MTTHPTLEGVAYVSGRLSGNLQRADLNTGEFTHANQEMIWPVAPAIHGDRLFVVDGLLGEIWEIDPDTLETRTVLTDSLGTNPFLLMPDLTISGSGSLLLSHGPDNALLEIDPDTGQVLSSWALGGLPPASPDAAGKLEVLLSSVYDEVAFVGRLTDGVISRVDMGTGEVLSTTLGPAQLELLSHTPWGALFEDEELLHVGNTALDSRDLSPVPGRDLGLSVPLSSHPSGHIGWQRDGGRLVLRSPDGSITTLAELDYDGEQEPSLAWGSWEQPALLWVGFGVSGLRALRLVED